MGAPAKDPLDIKWRETHSMEGYTCADAEGVGAPAAEVFGVLDRVKMVDSNGKAPDKVLDVISSDKLDAAGRGGPVHREWSGVGGQVRVEMHQLLEPGKGSIRRGNKAETSLVGVPSKQLFLAVLAVFLGMPDDPHFGNLEQGMCQNGEA
jgi:hypothetical protein